MYFGCALLRARRGRNGRGSLQSPIQDRVLRRERWGVAIVYVQSQAPPSSRSIQRLLLYGQHMPIQDFRLWFLTFFAITAELEWWISPPCGEWAF